MDEEERSGGEKTRVRQRKGTRYKAQGARTRHKEQGAREGTRYKAQGTRTRHKVRDQEPRFKEIPNHNNQ
jgi:hypothetical protein